MSVAPIYAAILSGAMPPFRALCREPLIDYFAVALRCHWCRDKARLEANGPSPSQEAQRRVGANDRQPIDVQNTLFRVGTDWTNNIVAMAREAYGHHVAIAPRSSSKESQAAPRNSQSEFPGL
jgi:hypothetical protein